MIENRVFILHGDMCREQIPDGAHDACRGQVALGIVVAPHDQNARMLAMRSGDEIVKVEEISMIAAQENTAFLRRVRQMNRIVFARQTDIRWTNYVVARLGEQLGELSGGAVVVQVKSHERLMRATSRGSIN